MRRLRRLTAVAVRCLLWLCLFSILSPDFRAAADPPAPPSVPIVSKLSGAVSVRGQNGISNDVISSRVIHSGDLLMTGVDSLALINLADVGSVRIGPTSTAQALVHSNGLTVNISSGSACAQALTRGVNVVAGPLNFSAATEDAIFSLIATQDATTLAVYQGSVTATIDGSRATTFKAGEAVVTSGNTLQQVALSSVQPSFAALQCPDQTIIAAVMPSAGSGTSSGGGHGGGGGGILAALLGLGAIVAAAGGHGGGGNSAPPNPTPTPTIAPGTLNVNNSNISLVIAGSSQPFTATEANYAGPINAVSNDKTVATVSPASGTGPSVQFTVTPVGVGNTTITVTDNHGGQQTVNVTVAPPGSINLVPNNLTFLVSPVVPQTFKATESNYQGSLTAVSNDTTVATVAGSGPSPATFTVTPVGHGTTTISVSGGSAPATENVTVIGPLVTNPNSLTFLTPASQSFTATDPFYNGIISASSSDQAVATVAPVGSTSGPGPVTFSVTPVNEGIATITVTDTFGGSTTVSASVSSGDLVVNPLNLVFTVGSADQTFTAAEGNYTGKIFAKSQNTSVATVSPKSGQGPGPITFTVHAVAAGNGSIVVTDNHGGSQVVGITVTGPISVGPPSSLTFNGNATPQNLSVSDPNYFGAIAANSSNVTVATINSPQTGPNATFTVTPQNQSSGTGTATITFSDANSGSGTANITVIPGPLTVSTNSVTLNGAGTNTQFTASEVLYSGSISATSQDTTVATVAPASGNGPGPVSFTVTAVAPGSTNISVADNHLGSQLVGVTVKETPTLVPSTLTFTDITPAQTTTLAETNYGGNLTLTGDTCGPGGIATITPATAVGPSATVTITPKSSATGGSCQFQYKDSFGNTSAPATVTVGPFGAISPVPTSFTFMDVGSGAASPLTVSESNYTGSFAVDDTNCSGIASVNPSSSTGNFTVTPNAQGNCNLTITDDHGAPSVQVGVTVGPFGAVVPSPQNINLTVGGSTSSFTVSESGYNGKFTLTEASCTTTGSASVSPLSGTSATPFIVTPGANANNCKIVITDDSGQTNNVFVFTTAGTLTVNPNQLTFPANSAGTTMTFTASDAACVTTMTAMADGTVAASVSPSGAQPCPGPVTYTVTAGANGQGSVTVMDGAGGSATVSVGVGMNPLRKAHRPAYSHKAQALPTGSNPVHEHGRPVTLPTLPTSTKPPVVGTPLTTAALKTSVANIVLAVAAGQPVALSESGYTRAFTIISSNPNVAAVNVQSASGPSASIVITGLTAGVSTIRVTDDHGGVVLIRVFVRTSEPKGTLLHPKK